MSLELALRARREALNITQNQLAKRIGVHPQFISNIERGVCELPTKYFKKISLILRLDVKDMVGQRASDFYSKLRKELL